MLQRIVVDLANIQPPDILLSTEQQHYLSRVLRLRAGDQFLVMDGQGHTWLACLQQMADSFNACILEPVNTQTELPLAVTLVIALPKGNGFDDIVRQATELGVATIVPVISDRTLLSPSAHKLDRWRRIAQEAAEQSERQVVPTLLAPVPLAEHLQPLEDSQDHVQNHVQEQSIPGTKYLCVTRQSAPHLLNCLLGLPGSPPSPKPFTLSVAVGPEGGWTEAEIAQAIAAGYQPVSLGDRILRTVTAPLVALSLIAAMFESRYD